MSISRSVKDDQNGSCVSVRSISMAAVLAAAVVTVNEYLAKRDSEWMGKVYRYMGLTVGLWKRNGFLM